MKKTTTPQEQVVQLRCDIRERIEARVRQAIEVVLEEELVEALGSERYERSAGRRGYRHGAINRWITTTAGTGRLRIPRGRLVHPDGSTKEFRSEVLPRYARRSSDV